MNSGINMKQPCRNTKIPIPSVYVINRAEPSYEKVSPKLWKIGLIIVLSTLVLVIGTLLLIEKINHLRSC